MSLAFHGRSARWIYIHVTLATCAHEREGSREKKNTYIIIIFDMGLLSFTEDTEPSLIDDKVKWKEEGDELISARKSRKEKSPKTTDGVYSLSYDQVNDNADELIELRGEGRYFGVTDPSTGSTINSQQSLGPLCDNCHKRGHVRSKCKTVVCHKCGVVGDHYETQCPTTMICSRCGERGHMVSMCKSKTRKRQYCRHCDTFSHGDDNCPSIWRSYITKVQKDEEYVLPAISCYNCGDDTHFGDECPEARSSRIPNTSGSAFSGSNLPKHLRSVYFESIGQGSTKKYTSSFSNSYSLDYNQGYNLNYNGSKYSKSSKQSYQSGSKASSRNYNAAEDANPRNFQQKYSSYLEQKTSGKKGALPSKPATASRSGYLPNKKGVVKPNRTGVLKGKKRNYQNLY